MRELRVLLQQPLAMIHNNVVGRASERTQGIRFLSPIVRK